jgi:hypothetical protein
LYDNRMAQQVSMVEAVVPIRVTASLSALSMQPPIVSAWTLEAMSRIEGTTCAATESTT